MYVELGKFFVFLGLFLLLFGFLLIFLPAAREGRETVEGALVVFIGPIPIALGTSKRAVFLGLLLGLLALLFLYFIKFLNPYIH